MSPEHQLTVCPADPTAEITVYDASFNKVGRGIGHYRGVHRDGLYEIRVRAGGGIEAKLISLAKDEHLDFGPVAFASPIPLKQTSTSDEIYQAAVVRACQAPVSLGQGSGLLVAVRDRLGREPVVAPESPASGLSLIDPDGTRVFDLGQHVPVDLSGRSPVAAIYLHVKPGVYRLRLDLPEGPARERTLVASPGWTIQCFMVRRPIRKERVADLAQGSLSLDRLDQLFSPDDDMTRLSEAARDALANNRQVTDAATRALMYKKFEYPMLGLLVAHLLFRDTPENPVLQEVVSNLVGLLGKNHPDVQAIALGTPWEGTPKPITEMPMLRASWDRIVGSTVTRPDLVPSNSPAGQLSTRVLPSAPWLVWRAADTSSTRPSASKMEVLRSYLRRPAESALPSGLEATFPTPAVSLDREDREELTRSLGVPNSVLDDMLSNLDG